MRSVDSHRLARRFIELPLEKRRLFIAGLQAEGVDFQVMPITSCAGLADCNVASYAQRRMWFLWRLDPASAAYNLPMAARLIGALDQRMLERAFELLISRHETLRTVFHQLPDGSLRQVPSERSVYIEWQDIEQLPGDEQARFVISEAETHSLQPFNLEEGPLLHIKLLRLSTQEHVLLLCLHHIVADGWSLNVLIDELGRLYDACVLGNEAELPELPIQYSDYALWQRSWLESGELQRQLTYWLQQLAGEQPALELPLDHPRPAMQSYRGARWDIPLSAELSIELRQLAQQQGVTVFMVLLASFQALLHRYSGQDDIRVGVPIANRHRVETERLIGLFVNTQVLRARIDGQLCFSELLAQTKRTVSQAQAHQDLPFDQLVEALQPQRSLSHSPLFQVMFNHQATVTKLETSRTASGLSLGSIDRESQAAQFDLMLSTYEHPQGITAVLTYATDLFEAETIERLGRHWVNVLAGIASNLEQRIGELPLLSNEERRRQLQEWNRTEASYPSECCIHELIEVQAEKTPRAVALVFGKEALSYCELNTRANRLAHRLRALGVGPDELVGIAVERSVEMVVGLLGILKAGGAYVPLDPEYPPDRLAYMMQDSGVRLLLTQSHLQTQLPLNAAVRTLLLDDVSSDAIEPGNPVCCTHPNNLAYVIYTSGSTGRPKGVGNTHTALVNRLSWMQKAYRLGQADAILQKTPFSFDVSVWEFFWPLLSGARLVVAQPGAHRDPEQLVDTINRHEITTLHFVPSMLQAFLTSERVDSCHSIQRLVCSGEALSTELSRQAMERLPGAGLFNLYGPTEAAIDVTHWRCRRDAGSSVPIGGPIDNLKTHIVDGALALAAPGIVGELHLGGVGLARGYHGRPSLTAECFIPDAFEASEHGGGRLYRTGDLARYRVDGVIEYVGRIDHQVKIRGFRIELGEIEAKLLEQPAVRDAVVVAQESASGKQLVGYVMPTPEQLLLFTVAGEDQRAELQRAYVNLLKASLKCSLPEYMVPVQVVILEQLPLTPNGKLDRKALPKPDSNAPSSLYVAPVTELEQQIASIWAEVLGMERVGLTDNFFALGGDSIISIQVVSRARQTGIQFTPKELFQHQTVQGLARIARRSDALAFEQGPITGPAPLLPVQQAFFETAIPERHHWNQAVLLRPKALLDPERLEQALRAIVVHHDALRLSFAAEQGSVSATYRTLDAQQNAWVSTPLVWQSNVANASGLISLCTNAQRSLDLRSGPLLRAVLATLPDGTQRLLLAIHHLVIDGVSWRILLEDLHTAYRQLESNKALRLQAKTSAYRVWGERLQLAARSEAFQAELDYWRTQLADAPLDLPRDHPDGRALGQLVRTVYSSLDAASTQQLLQQAPAAYRTRINDLLLTALARVITRWTHESSVLIQLEGHGREDLFEDMDLTRTIGWFTTLYPVRLTPAVRIGDSIKQIKEQLRAVPNGGLGYGVLRYLGNEAARQTLSALPIPRITFNYLGQFDSSFSEQNALFAPAIENAGLERSKDAPLDNWLSVDGQVYGGELRMGWTFSVEMLEEETVQGLTNAYADELRTLIEHCTSEGVAAITPSDVPLSELTQAQLDNLPIPSGEIEDIYSASPMQQGMLFHTLYAHEAGDYVNQLRVNVDGLHVERFRLAWQAAAAKHEILRTGFVWQGELSQPVQIVRRQITVPFAYYDWRAQPELETALQTLAEGERQCGFDLAQAPLLRLVLVCTGETRHHLIYTYHHILMDGWSSSQLLDEVLRAYAGAPLYHREGRYCDYIEWLQSRDAATSERFWKQQLQRLEGPTRLTDTMRRSVISDRAVGYGEHEQKLDRNLTSRLKAFAQQQRLTLNTLVQAAWLLLLQRYTGQDAVAFGATVAGRPTDLKGIEQQIGLYINTLPVIARVRPDQRVADWLREVQSHNLALREHEHTPLYEIQRWAGYGGEALFDTLLVFENYPVREVLEHATPQGVRFTGLRHYEQSGYPLSVVVSIGECLSVQYRYALTSLDAVSIEEISAHLNLLLHQLTQPEERWVGELELVEEDERRCLLDCREVAERASDAQQYVHQLIEEQARNRPQAVALVCDGQCLSYAELNSRANRLAHRLIAQGVAPDVLVGVALERGLDMVVGLLAILKAGGAYVPLDPEYPAQRLAYMIADSGISLLLSNSAVAKCLPDAGRCEVLSIDGLSLHEEQDANPQVELSAHNLLCLIYTSGSTGRPKGVTLEQAALLTHIRTMQAQYLVTADDRVLHFASINFDWGTEQWLLPLASGARCILRGEGIWSPAEAFAVIEREQLSIVYFPTQYACQLAAWAQTVGRRLAVRSFNVAGEAFPREGFEHIKRVLQPRCIVNGYGPTETVITPFLWEATGETRFDSPYAPIGRPVAGRTAYILAEQLTLQPEHLAGELYIGGDCLARGYHGRAALTAERFIPDPFSQHSGARLYRSGDLTRCRRDGVVEYVGRIDHQVKIRGFRVEIGEIEGCLLTLESVREVAVLAQDGPLGQRLVAHIVPTNGVLVAADFQAQDAYFEEVRRLLKLFLPDYMVPSQWSLLDRLPLTPNGKLDRKALSSLESRHPRRSHVAPQTELERLLAAIWTEALAVSPIGLQDNFFALGGHSLLATQIVSRVRHRLGIELPLRTLFELPCLSDFAAAVERRQPAANIVVQPPPLRRVANVERQPLSFAQQRLWFLWQLEPTASMYNIPCALSLQGELDLHAVREAVAALLSRHSILRTTYFEEAGESWQKVHAQMPLPFEVCDLTSLAEADRVRALDERLRLGAQLSFNLVDGPLLRMQIVRIEAQRHVLLMTLHHIVADQWSLGILLREFLYFYRAFHTQAPALLPDLPFRYVDFAVWQREWLATGEMQRQLNYWLDHLGTDHRISRLSDSAQEDAHSAGQVACNVYAFRFSMQLSDCFRAFASERGVTLYMLLLAGFALIVSQRSGSSRVRLGTDIANRNHLGIEDMVGFFVNQLVLQLTVEQRMSAAQLLAACRIEVMAALDHQDLPFDRLVEALRLPKRSGRSPLFNIKFIYQESADDWPQLDGLEMRPHTVGHAAAEMDLIAEFVNSAIGIQVNLKCDAKLHTAADMACLFDQLGEVLTQMTREPDIALTDLLARAEVIQARSVQAQSHGRRALLKTHRPLRRRNEMLHRITGAQ